MMFSVAKEFHFSASHQLGHLPEDHPCSRLHGHNYVVILRFEAIWPDENGFVIDYRELDSFNRWLQETHDHRHLNDIYKGDGKLTTAERLAETFFGVAHKLYGKILKSVSVKETAKTIATYELSTKIPDTRILED